MSDRSLLVATLVVALLALFFSFRSATLARDAADFAASAAFGQGDASSADVQRLEQALVDAGVIQDPYGFEPFVFGVTEGEVQASWCRQWSSEIGPLTEVDTARSRLSSSASAAETIDGLNELGDTWSGIPEPPFAGIVDAIVAVQEAYQDARDDGGDIEAALVRNIEPLPALAAVAAADTWVSENC